MQGRLEVLAWSGQAGPRLPMDPLPLDKVSDIGSQQTIAVPSCR